MAVTMTLSSWTAPSATLSLTVSGGSSVTRLTRTDANGTAGVRLPAGTLPITSSTTVKDYEYSVDTTYKPGVEWTAWSGSVAVAQVNLLPNKPGMAYLTVPRRPTLGATIWEGDPIEPTNPPGRVVVRFNADRQGSASVHQVVDRADPVIVLHPLPMRTGSLQIRCVALDAVRYLSTTLQRAEVFMLRQADVYLLDFYFTVSALHISTPDPGPGERRYWLLDVDFTEVARLPGEVTVDPDWTYAGVATENTTYLALLGKYTNYGDLLTRGRSA